ncbi:MAG: hypothetical protein KBS83_00240 [Lachnospiraceae bacterium]|nr:hypothetical protein [Candidatus Equihabitans merdae]
MRFTREEAVERMLTGYSVYYNVERLDEEQKPLTAVCEFFQRDEKYVISKKANVWTTEMEEFLYVIDQEHLTKEDVVRWSEYVWEEGLKKANVGPGHMCTNAVAVFVCNTCDAEAAKALKKCRHHKSFQWSLRGWMDLQTVLVEVDTDGITSNSMGRNAAALLKKVLL